MVLGICVLTRQWPACQIPPVFSHLTGHVEDSAPASEMNVSSEANEEKTLV